MAIDLGQAFPVLVSTPSRLAPVQEAIASFSRETVEARGLNGGNHHLRHWPDADP